MPTPGPLAANARMYAITERSAAAWQAIFAWLSRASGVELAIVDHPPPARLAELWSRSGLGCVAMCGWPFVEARPRPHLLASPVPAPARFEGRPQYWSDLVVHRDSRYATLEDTFGGVVGWTLEDSHSGFNMLRHHLLAFRSEARPRLFARSVGGLINPAGALGAVASGVVDVAPIDSFCHDLLRAAGHPSTLETRTVGRTAASPMPVLIASPDLDEGTAGRIRAALLQAHDDREIAPALADAMVERFVLPELEAFERTRRLAREALAESYPEPG